MAMPKFVINGGKILTGDIEVSGSKNATLPLMAACLLSQEECVLTNLPNIKDVETMVAIIEELGVKTKREGHSIAIDAKGLNKSEPSRELVGKLRGSLLLLGSLLGRTGRAALPFPGGDRIGKRPIDTHVEAVKALGVKVEENEAFYFSCSRLKGAKIVLEETSVTATENAMMAAVLAQGTTIIKLAAMEPHVQQLGEFLNKMGAKISGLGSPTLIIEGVAKLHGASINIIPDSEESASLITLAAATKSNITILKTNPDFLEDYLMRIKKMGVRFDVGQDYVKVYKPDGEYRATKIQCGFYPKLNSDYIPPMSVLATQAAGETMLFEWLYENRLGYIPELVRMGAKAEVLDPHRVKISGPTPLKGQKITSFDLRMGMTLVIASLVAEGESEISEIQHVDRGYEHLEKRLANLGADIKRID